MVIRVRLALSPFVVIAAITSPPPLDAQAVLRGVVVSDSAGTALAGAVVEIAELRRNASTDARGTFEFTDVPSGRYRVQARFVGYRPRTLEIRVRGTEALRLIFQLAPLPVVLDSLSVVAPAPEAYNPLMRGFSDRRLIESGHFLGPGELEQLEHTDLAGVLRMFHVPIRRTRRTNRPYAGARPGRSLSRQDSCPAQVFLDGQMLSNRLEPFDISTVSIQSLAGVEYYESLARIPNQFQQGDWQCGVVVLWTRLRKP